MQSDRNILCGDVVSDSINIALRNEDNISVKLLYEHLKKKIFNF